MMSFKKIIKKIMKQYYNSYVSKKIYKYEIKNIKKKKNILEKVELTVDQEKEIQDFFVKNYGKKIDTKWHRLYQSYTGKFDKRYFPEIIFSTELQPLLRDKNIAKQLADKSMVELLYRDIEGLYIPKTIVLNCSGVWYDSDRNIITKETVLKELQNCGKKIIKKIVGSNSGCGVLIVNIKNGYDSKNKLSLEQILNEFNE